MIIMIITIVIVIIIIIIISHTAIFNNYSGPAANRHSRTLVSGQLCLRPPSQNPVSIPMQTLYISTLILVRGHSRPRFTAYELDFGFGVF